MNRRSLLQALGLAPVASALSEPEAGSVIEPKDDVRPSDYYHFGRGRVIIEVPDPTRPEGIHRVVLQDCSDIDIGLDSEELTLHRVGQVEQSIPTARSFHITARQEL